MPFPSQPFIMHYGHTFCNLRYDCKTNVDFFFLLLIHNFMNWRFILIVDLSNLSIYFFLLSWKLSLFSLKSWHFTAFGVSELTASSCASGSLLSKRKVTWTQALQYCNSWSDNPDSYWMTKGYDMLERGMVHLQGKDGAG